MPIHPQENFASKRRESSKPREETRSDLTDDIELMLELTDEDCFTASCIECDACIPEESMRLQPFVAFCQQCSQDLGLQFPEAA